MSDHKVAAGELTDQIGAVRHRFATKTGECLITAEKLHLTRKGARGILAKQLVGESINRMFLTYTLMGSLMILASVGLYLMGSRSTPLVLLAIGVWILKRAYQSRNFSTSNSIDLADIQSIEEHPPYPGRRGYFSLNLRSDTGATSRLIMLPSSINEAEAAFSEASKVLRNLGIPISN